MIPDLLLWHLISSQIPRGISAHLVALRLLSSVLRTASVPTSNTTQIHSTTNQVVLHTRTILSSATTNLDDTVLLNIVTYNAQESATIHTNRNRNL